MLVELAQEEQGEPVLVGLALGVPAGLAAQEREQPGTRLPEPRCVPGLTCTSSRFDPMPGQQWCELRQAAVVQH